MGYPPFVRPQEPISKQQIEANPMLARRVEKNPRLAAELMGGRAGEPWWFQLPADLRRELDEYIASYEPKQYGSELSTFDGPCCWFDMETRRCQHHEHRPQVCRDFETGSHLCWEWRRHYRDRIFQPEA